MKKVSKLSSNFLLYFFDQIVIGDVKYGDRIKIILDYN